MGGRPSLLFLFLTSLLYHISENGRQLVGCKYFTKMQTELLVGTELHHLYQTDF